MARNTARVASEPSAEMVVSSTAMARASPAGLADIRTWATGWPPTKPWMSRSGAGFGRRLGRWTRKGGWARPPYSGEPVGGQRAGHVRAADEDVEPLAVAGDHRGLAGGGPDEGTGPAVSQKNTGMMTGRTAGSPCVW